MTGQVTIGLLGGGFAHDFHMMSYSEIPSAKITTVGARTKKEAMVFAQKWNIKNTVYGDDAIEKICSIPEIDVIDVAVPNFLHKRAVIAAAKNGKHVICEKPLATTLQDAKDMLNIVEKTKVIHCYAENQVFAPQITRAKELIYRGAVGRPFWIRTREAHSGPHSKWFWKRESAGGGVLLDMGCHSVEVVRFLMGKNPIEAFSWGATLVHDTTVEDNSVILIKYKDGEIGQSENSWAARGGLDLRYEIYGSEGSIFIDSTRETGIKAFSLASEKKVGYIIEKAEADKGWFMPIWREHQIYGYLAELQHFVASLAAGELPRENFRDGYAVIQMLDAGYRSMRSGKWERIK